MGEGVRRAPALVVLVLLAVNGCAGDGGSVRVAQRERSPRTAVAPSSRAAPPTTSTTTSTTVPPRYDAGVAELDEATRARMTTSWRPGCPVPLDDLRLVRLDHWGYDGAEHTGELVVHRDLADGIVRVFASLWDAGYPIERMQLVDVYGGNDGASTPDNNTAAFNCRDVVGRPGAWSEHAYGRAIDVNPLVNPYTLDPSIGDPALAPDLDRSLDAPGLLRAGDPAVEAFAARGGSGEGRGARPTTSTSR